MFLDGEKIGTEALTSDTYPRANSHSVYDIGLKRDDGNAMRGYIRDLMVVGRALTGEELNNITGKPKYFFLVFYFDFFAGKHEKNNIKQTLTFAPIMNKARK